MTALHSLHRLALIGCLVAACTDSGYVVRKSQEVAVGTVTIDVRPEGEPIAGAPVLIHDSTGALFAEVETSSNGTVDTDIPANAQVTVLLDLPNDKLWAAVTRGVQPGTALVLDGMPHAPYEEGRRPPVDQAFQLRLPGPYTREGGRSSIYLIEDRVAHAREHIFEIGAIDTNFGPYPREPLAMDRYGTPGTFGALAYVRSSGTSPPFPNDPILAYSFGEIAANAPAGEVLQLPPWRTDLRTLHLDIGDAAFFSRAIVTAYHDGAAFELNRDTRAGAGSEPLTMVVPPNIGTLQSVRVCGHTAGSDICRIQYETEIEDQMPVALPEPLPFESFDIEALEGGAIAWSPPPLGDARPDETVVFEARWLEDAQHHENQKLVAWTVAYAADEVGPFELPSLPEKHRRFYPLHAFSSDANLIRGSSTVTDRATTLAHFGSWPVLLHSPDSIERVPGAEAGDSVQLSVVRELTLPDPR